MLSKRSEHRKALRKLLPLIETQRNDLELHKSLDQFKNHTEVIEQQKDQLEENVKKIEDLEDQIANQKSEIENYKKQVEKMAEEKEQLLIEIENLPLSPSHKSQIECQKREIENYKEKLTEVTEEREQLINDLINKLHRKVEEFEKLSIDQQNQNKSIFLDSFFGRNDKEQPKKIKEFEQQLKKMAEEMEDQIRTMLEPIPENFHLSDFLNEQNLQTTMHSTVVIKGLLKRLYKRQKGDSDKCEPPLKRIDSFYQRRREVFDFIQFIRTNWYDAYSGTNIQKRIRDWFFHNCQQFMYNPSEEEKESSRQMFLNKFKLENTIGTIHFLPIRFREGTEYYSFAISNYRIVSWDWNSSQQQAYSDLYDTLQDSPKWTNNLKFATVIVDNYKSDKFIHTPNKDVFVENEKVVTWMKNNFDLEQRDRTYWGGSSIIPILYIFFVNFYGTSVI